MSEHKIAKSLTQFLFELEAFEKKLMACSQVLAASGKVRHSVRGRMGDCGMDITYCGNTFATAHAEATFWAIDSIEVLSQTLENWELRIELLARKDNSLAGHRERESHRGLSVAYKSILFFLRAFQDSAYAVLVELTGGRAPTYPSMSECLAKKQNGPSYRIISEIEGYAAWFFKMRDWRNRIKSGVGFGQVGPQTNIGVAFVHITDGNSLTFTNDTIHLRDLIECVRFSTLLVERIARLAQTDAASC